MAQAAETGQSSGAASRIPPRLTVSLTGIHIVLGAAYSARMPSPTGRALVNAQAVIESFSLSADGERLVYALRQVRGGRYVSHLWSVPWSGGRASRLTSGAVRDVNPAISPDGRLVAFARTAVGPDPGEAQIWILPLDGGAAWQLTKQRHGAGDTDVEPGRQAAAVPWRGR